MRLPNFLAASLMSTVLATLASAGVDVLGKPQLGTFPTIQGAIDLAADGDILIVGSGAYPGFTIDNKSLSVFAAPGASVQVQGTCEVRNLGPNRRVALVGLSASATQGFQGLRRAGLELADNLGSVRLQDCSFTGSRPQWLPGAPLGPSGSGADVARSSKVVFTRCTLLGRDLGLWSGETARTGGEGLNALDSAVALYECSLRGGRGSEESYPRGGNGGAGCRVGGWGLFASGTTIEGARGGGGDYLGCTRSGDGGDGLHITDAQARLFDTAIIRGSAGAFFTCTSGVGGRRVVASGASVMEYGTQHRSLGGPRFANDNSLALLRFTGRPGDSVFLLVDTLPTFTFLFELAGVATVRQPWLPIPVGVVGPSGTLDFSYAIPDITTAQPGSLRYFQALVVNGQEQCLSTPFQMLVINT